MIIQYFKFHWTVDCLQCQYINSTFLLPHVGLYLREYQIQETAEKLTQISLLWRIWPVNIGRSEGIFSLLIYLLICHTEMENTCRCCRGDDLTLLVLLSDNSSLVSHSWPLTTFFFTKTQLNSAFFPSTWPLATS